MTEMMFRQLEEKMMIVLSEIEILRKEIQRLAQENTTLKFERETNTQKLQGLISLLDTLSLVESPMMKTGVQIGEPVFQG